LLIKVEFFFCLHILYWATESEKYIILTLFYDQNYVNLSNLKFHPLCHTKSSFFWKSPTFNIIIHDLFYVQWVKIGDDCLFCWCCLNCLSSLFKLSFHNVWHLFFKMIHQLYLLHQYDQQSLNFCWYTYLTKLRLTRLTWRVPLGGAGTADPSGAPEFTPDF
jgi:hypothetical protein